MGFKQARKNWEVLISY